MKRVLFLMLMVLCVGFAQAVVINVDYGGRTEGTPGDGNNRSYTPFSGQGAYSDPGNDYWTSVARRASASNLLASDGITDTGVSVSHSGGDGFEDTGKTNYLLSDYVYGTSNVTIDGLTPDGLYIVYVYACGDQPGQGSNITIGEVTQTTTNTGDPDYYELGTNYVIFNDVTADATGQLIITTDEKFNGFQIIDAITRGAAHSPDPTGDSVDPAAVSVVSWYSPEQDMDGVVVDDPNLTVVGYDVWWSVGAEPNYVDDSPTYQAAPDQDFAPGPLAYETTYYWRVDTHVVWDSNEITGNFSDVIESRPWQFTTKPDYVAPTVTMANVVTTLDIDEAYVSAVVGHNSTDIASVQFIVLDDDVDWPGTAPTQTDDDPMNMLMPGTTLTGLAEGTYKVKLLVTDTGTETDGPTTAETIAEVKVYADACAAKQGDESSDWVQSEYDVTGPDGVPDCLVNLLDFVEFAKQWLNNSSLLAPESYEGTVLYVPQAVYDARIDAVEDIIDPNVTCSDAPITDTEGIQIETDRANATDSTNLGSAATDSWVEYEVTLDAGTYDVYAGYSCDSGTGQELSFGIDGEPAKYGTVFLPATGSWDTFWGHYVGEVTFTESGTQTVRTTYGGYSNMDWFAFDPQ